VTIRQDPATVTGPALRRFMRRWATGVAVVTTTAQDRPTGCTANSFTSVSLTPPLVLVSLAQQSRTLASIMRHGAFGVCLLGRRQRGLADRFASAPPEDRFTGVAHRTVDGVPVLTDAMAAMACRVEHTIAAADHVLVLGRPTWCDCDGSPDPIVHFGSHYQSLAGPPHD
jgi:flavin reductase (DIM6/NTAB) family NADH-FMN oxidoreductase RutF